jgi:hypothetical protein
MSRPRWQLRDAAVGYASRGIPVLPLHYPLPHRGDLVPVRRSQQRPRPAEASGCSCRDPGCGQVGKHPLGNLVPHGVTDATCNRARIWAWWTRHPQANIGLACGHIFDVLDVDGPTGAQAIRELAATHGLASCGPLVRTGGGGWHYYLAPTGLGNVQPQGLEHVDWRGQGGYVVAPPSRHASGQAYRWVPGRDLDLPPGEVPGVLLERLQPHQRQRPTAPVPSRGSATTRGTGTPGRRWPRSSPGSPPPRSATATSSYGSRPATSTTWSPAAPSTTAKSTRGCLRRPSAADSSLTSPARPAAPSPQPARSASSMPAAHPSPPTPKVPIVDPPRGCGRSGSQPGNGGDGHGRRRPAGRLSSCSRGGRVPRPSRARAHPNHPQEGVPGWAAHQP